MVFPTLDDSLWTDSCAGQRNLLQNIDRELDLITRGTGGDRDCSESETFQYLLFLTLTIKVEDDKKSTLEKIQNSVYQVQQFFGSFSSVFESLENVFNISIPFLSIICLAALVLTTILLYFLPLRLPSSSDPSGIYAECLGRLLLSGESTN